MRATLRLAALTISLVLTSGQYAVAQNPPPPQGGSFTPGELVREGHRFFGTVSRGLAQVVEKAVSRRAMCLGRRAAVPLSWGCDTATASCSRRMRAIAAYSGKGLPPVSTRAPKALAR